LVCAEHASNRRTYGRVLRRIVTEFAATPRQTSTPERYAMWFTAPGPGPNAVPRRVVQLLTRDISLRERTLRWMLYETAARSAEVLALDVEDLDLPNRVAKVRRKGGTIDVIVWQIGTVRFLPRLLEGHKSDPVFVDERRAALGGALIIGTGPSAPRNTCCAATSRC
jgi:integrase